jgi:hypothetical protein
MNGALALIVVWVSRGMASDTRHTATFVIVGLLTCLFTICLSLVAVYKRHVAGAGFLGCVGFALTYLAFGGDRSDEDGLWVLAFLAILAMVTLVSLLAAFILEVRASR